MRKLTASEINEIAEYFPNFPLRFEVYPNPFVR